jgi:tetratricopeptide (TPR) repeat protein
MAKSWSDQETRYLERYARTKTLSALAERFEATEGEVRARLAALALVTKDGEPAGGGHRSAANDPEIGDYEQGLEALGAGKLPTARKLFERVVAGSDRRELAARARQHLKVIERLTGGGAGAEEDAFTRAVFERNRGDHAAALALVEGQKADADGRYAYLAATLHALAGREAEAAEALRRAVDRDPKNRVRAYHDPDLGGLRQKRDYAHLFGLDQS